METVPRTLHRVQDLWFEDGNLVIQAGDSQFRLFRGILAARSSVFEDMISFPQPHDSELVEGCPVVYLSDSPIEVRAFLRAIFDPEFFLPFPAKTDFDTVCGCLRLSHKYGVDYLRRRALVHLSSRYPTTLSDCEAMPTTRSWERPTAYSYLLFIYQLAREVDAAWLLPYVCYVLCWSLEAGLGTAIFHGAIYNGISVSLSAQDHESFLRGYRVQKESMHNDILRFLFSPAKIPGCTDPARCLQVRFEVLDAFSQRIKAGGPGYSSQPLHTWPAQYYWTMLHKACPTCLAHLKTRYQRARQGFWDRLPEMYGLPPWEELEKTKATAFGSDLPGNI
ncbi:hypothetical protein B0H19DRAFT_990737 [Mycena capillaripes]|nr:hypothetical protein B0H19DRAFT_990737 [Mycena capillaripes]